MEELKLNRLGKMMSTGMLLVSGACGFKQEEPAFTAESSSIEEVKQDKVPRTESDQSSAQGVLPEVTHVESHGAQPTVEDSSGAEPLRGLRHESHFDGSQVVSSDDHDIKNDAAASHMEMDSQTDVQVPGNGPQGGTGELGGSDGSGVATEAGGSGGGSGQNAIAALPSTPPVSPPVVAESPSPVLDPNENFDQVVQVVTDLCQTRPLQKVTQLIEFEPMSNACTWYPSGFEGKDYIQGVRSQRPKIEPQLPQGAVLCSVELNSQSQSTKTWVFDDEFYFTLNRKVLVASHRSSLDRFSKSDGFYDFDFSKLVGMPYSILPGNGIYCFGHDPLSHANSCVFPATQTIADVDYSVNPSEVSRIGALVKTQGKHNFELFVTGDNDPKVDCKHSGIKFDLAMHYVMPN